LLPLYSLPFDFFQTVFLFFGACFA
jgi:hypothetical protein